MKCPLCDKPVAGNYGLGQHFRRHHPGQLRKVRAAQCEACGKTIKPPPSAKAHLSYGAKRRFCSQRCHGLASQREQHPNWKGGLILSKGYKLVRVGNHYEFEHRVVMERVLGVKLTPNLHVHHIDGDPLNNDPKNLVVLTNAEHQKLHPEHLKLATKVRMARRRAAKKN